MATHTIYNSSSMRSMILPSEHQEHGYIHLPHVGHWTFPPPFLAWGTDEGWGCLYDNQLERRKGRKRLTCNYSCICASFGFQWLDSQRRIAWAETDGWISDTDIMWWTTWHTMQPALVCPQSQTKVTGMSWHICTHNGSERVSEHGMHILDEMHAQ